MCVNLIDPKVFSYKKPTGISLPLINRYFTGNTALHCLFNETNSLRLDSLRSQYGADVDRWPSVGGVKALDEFGAPQSLSRILFALLRYGGLKPFVNTANYEHKVNENNKIVIDY